MPAPKDINAYLKRLGTIKITEADTGIVTYSGTYAVEDILAALNAGFTVEQIMDSLDDLEKVSQLSPNAVEALRNGGVL